MSAHVFGHFDRVRIINLVDRPDRRREITRELERLGPIPGNVAFYDANRPTDAGDFPSIGARGCFESHLTILRSARDAGAKSVLVLEDDLDFARDAKSRLEPLVRDLFNSQWDFFYGAHLLAAKGRPGLRQIASDEGVLTTSFVGFNGEVLGPLVDSLEAMLLRPAGRITGLRAHACRRRLHRLSHAESRSTHIRRFSDARPAAQLAVGRHAWQDAARPFGGYAAARVDTPARVQCITASLKGA